MSEYEVGVSPAIHNSSGLTSDRSFILVLHRALPDLQRMKLC